VQEADYLKTRRIAFRYIFPIASFAVAGLLLFVPSWQASRDRARGEDGVAWGEIGFHSPPVATEFVRAMYLPAAVAVAPVLISGMYLTQVCPIYGREIEIFGLLIVALAGILQWYWIGWLLEGQTGYRLASREH
jgi:hypothetical protein